MKLFGRQISEMTSACLGNKERADRIAISANAVKGLLRPVMVKMGSFEQLRAGRYRPRPEDVRDRPEIELAHLDSGIHRRLAAL